MESRAITALPYPAVKAPAPHVRSPRAPRVLFVIPGDGVGSSMIFVRRQIRSLQDAGVVGHTFYLGSRTSLRVLWRESFRFRDAVRAFAPDLIHAQYGTMTAFFCAACSTLPLVVTYRGSDLHPSPGISRLRSFSGRVLSQLAALRTSGITCVSERLRDRLWWCRSDAQVIPSGVDMALFYPRSRDEARAELGWPTDELTVLFNAGGNGATKRLDLAKASIEHAIAEGHRIRLVVLEGRTDPSRVPILLSAADCLLLTSSREGSPNIVKEAMACGLPVVSVDVGDVRQRLAGVEPSRIVAPDPRSIARALVEIVSMRARSNGREKIMAISSESTARKILSMYNSVLAS